LLALEVSSGRRATRVGKPEEFCFEVILKDFFADEEHKWADPEFLSQFLMVGDNLETDIWFGKNVGIKTCFVYSGISLYPPNQKIKELLEKMKPTHTMMAFTLSGEKE
jgi:ribonucleotide monophosphatase NagD (HAD superfamily)